MLKPFFEVTGTRFTVPDDDDHSLFVTSEPMRQSVRSGDIRRSPSTDEKKMKRRGSPDPRLTGGAVR